MTKKELFMMWICDDGRQKPNHKSISLHLELDATWILNFKRKHGIVSRKITKFVNRSTTRDKEQLQTACQEFINTVKSYIDLFGIENIQSVK